MALHLNWDNNQSNGVIFNDTYSTGSLFTGANIKPNIGIPYDSMQYSEVFEGLNYVQVGDVKTVMLPAQEAIIVVLATVWVQELGQEGNPSPAQIAEAAKNKALGNLARTDLLVTPDMSQHLTAEEATAVGLYREAQYLIIQTPPIVADPNDEPAPNPDLASAFNKFNIT